MSDGVRALEKGQDGLEEGDDALRSIGGGDADRTGDDAPEAI